MIGVLAQLAKQFALAAGRAAAERLAELASLALKKRVSDPEEPAQPLSHADVDWIEAQREAATSHRVPQPGKPPPPAPLPPPVKPRRPPRP